MPKPVQPSNKKTTVRPISSLSPGRKKTHIDSQFLEGRIFSNRRRTTETMRRGPGFVRLASLLPETLPGVMAMRQSLAKNATDRAHFHALSTLWQGLYGPTNGIWRNIVFLIQDE